MIAWAWMLAVRLLSLFVRRERTWRYVCACGYRSRVRAVQAETRDCTYCFREIVPERLP